MLPWMTEDYWGDALMESGIELLPGETIDRLGRRGLRIIQNPSRFKFTIDAFLLARFITPFPEQRVLDLGSGGGVLPLLLAGENGISDITGIEIQPELVEMAMRSVVLNHLQGQVRIVTGDLRNPPVEITPGTYDYVISNPPYFPVSQGVLSENKALATAKFELSCNLEDLVKAASRLVRANGRFALIYPPSRTVELFQMLAQFHLIPKRLRFVHSKPGSEAQFLLLEARPGGKSGVAVLPPLFVFDETCAYTAEMDRIFDGRESEANSGSGSSGNIHPALP